MIERPKPRWKVWVELIGGIIVSASGTIVVSESADLVPFAIHHWIPFVIGGGVAMYGWHIIGEAWKEI